MSINKGLYQQLSQKGKMIIYTENINLETIFDTLKNIIMSEKLKLFKYAVILHEKSTKDGRTEYTGAKLLVPPTDVLARTEREILMKAARAVPEEVINTAAEDVEIMIRPF
jgi:hypothetical protein